MNIIRNIKQVSKKEDYVPQLLQSSDDYNEIDKFLYFLAVKKSLKMFTNRLEIHHINSILSVLISNFIEVVEQNLFFFGLFYQKNSITPNTLC